MGIEQVKKSALRKKLVSTLKKKSNVFSHIQSMYNSIRNQK